MRRRSLETALTGATGRIGGRVAVRLATKGVPLRLLVRDPDRAPDLPGATPVVAPFADGDAVRAALAGVETAFMVSASEAADRAQQHVTFVEAAAAAGVRHLVYLSFQGASRESTFTFARDHAVTEEAIRASGMAWTFLRDSFYADFMPGSSVTTGSSAAREVTVGSPSSPRTTSPTRLPQCSSTRQHMQDAPTR